MKAEQERKQDMTLTMNLSPDEEARLREKAAQRGQDIGDYLLTLARREFSNPAEMYEELNKKFAGMSLAEALQGHIGLFDSRELNNGQMSDLAGNSEEEFGKIMDEKKRQGHV